MMKNLLILCSMFFASLSSELLPSFAQAKPRKIETVHAQFVVAPDILPLLKEWEISQAELCKRFEKALVSSEDVLSPFQTFSCFAKNKSISRKESNLVWNISLLRKGDMFELVATQPEQKHIARKIDANFESKTLGKALLNTTSQSVRAVTYQPVVDAFARLLIDGLPLLSKAENFESAESSAHLAFQKLSERRKVPFPRATEFFFFEYFYDDALKRSSAVTKDVNLEELTSKDSKDSQNEQKLSLWILSKQGRGGLKSSLRDALALELVNYEKYIAEENAKMYFLTGSFRAFGSKEISISTKGLGFLFEAEAGFGNPYYVIPKLGVLASLSRLQLASEGPNGLSTTLVTFRNLMALGGLEVRFKVPEISFSGQGTAFVGKEYILLNTDAIPGIATKISANQNVTVLGAKLGGQYQIAKTEFGFDFDFRRSIKKEPSFQMTNIRIFSTYQFHSTQLRNRDWKQKIGLDLKLQTLKYQLSPQNNSKSYNIALEVSQPIFGAGYVFEF